MTEEENKGKNLFEVNGIKYTDNIPDGMRISLTKEQYAEYLQQKELIEKLQKENENLKIDLEKANASIVDQTDKDNEIEHLENLLRGNLYDGYLYYKDIATQYQKNYISDKKLREEIIELKLNRIPKDKIREKIKYYEEIVEKGGYNLPFNRIRVETLKELLEEG